MSDESEASDFYVLVFKSNLVLVDETEQLLYNLVACNCRLKQLLHRIENIYLRLVVSKVD